MNRDKDIKRCKELIKTEHSNWIGMSNQDAIENVLEEFERLEKCSLDVPLLTEDLNKARKANHELHDENIKLQMERDKLKEELETYKKMADLMARQIDNYDTQLVINRFRSKEDVLDWARNEVENE